MFSFWEGFTTTTLLTARYPSDSRVLNGVRVIHFDVIISFIQLRLSTRVDTPDTRRSDCKLGLLTSI